MRDSGLLESSRRAFLGGLAATAAGLCLSSGLATAATAEGAIRGRFAKFYSRLPDGRWVASDEYWERVEKERRRVEGRG